MAEGLEVVDADAHVVEPVSFFAELFARFPDDVGVRADTQLGVTVEGRAYPQFTGPGAGCPPDKGLTDAPGVDPHTAAGVLKDADVDGIDEMVMFPSFGLCVPTLRSPVLGAGVARLYNEWAAEFAASGGGRLHATAVVPIEHVELAIEVMTEAKGLGLVAAVIPPALATRNLDHPDLDPFYAAAADLDMPLGVHGAPGIHLPKIGVDRFDNYIQVHCISFPFDQMTAMTALVSGGVFDRHPRLRVAFLEAGAGWLPWFIERLTEHFESRGDWIGNGWRRPPAEYVAAGNVRITCEPDEQTLPTLIEALGDDCVMFASDYPHWDGAWPRATAELREHAEGRLSAGSLAKVAGANARAFFGLKAPGRKAAEQFEVG
ncbi:MAG TPA: amidohydrolase family protein [Acidimicrobiales bacterium]|nr:amidohydrolase family protein [Acidimicrobiales bacterium]